MSVFYSFFYQKQLTLICAALCATLLCAPGLQSQSRYALSKREATLSALEVARTEAMIKKDLPTLAECLAEELSYTHTNSVTEDKAGFLDAIRSEKYIFRSYIIHPEIFRHSRRITVAHGRCEVKVFAFGKELEFQARYTAVYQKTKKGKWRLAAWQNTRVP